MTIQDALDCIREYIAELYYKQAPNENDNSKIIQALEEFAIPLIERRVEETKIFEEFIKSGLPSTIMTEIELRELLGAE